MLRNRRHLASAIAVLTVVAVLLGIWLMGDSIGSRDQEVVLSACHLWFAPGRRDEAILILDSLGAERSVRAMVKLYQTYHPSLRARWGSSLFMWWLNTGQGKWPTLDQWVMRGGLGQGMPDAQSVQKWIVEPLTHFGPAASPAVPLLVRRLEANGDSATIRTLGAIGGAAAPSLPHLRRLAATVTDPWFLYTITDSLRRIEPGSQVVALPTGIRGLTSTNERTRAKAVEVVGLIGPPASNAIPRLRELRKDTWKMVRDAAEEALRAIDPPSDPAKP